MVGHNAAHHESRRSITYLIDAHQLGARQTGNETWIRNICLELTRVVPPDELVVCVRHNDDLPFPVRRVHAVADSAVRRLLVDLPRHARRVHADAVLVQYTMPATRRPCVVMIQDMSPFDRRGSSWLGPAQAARIRMSITTSVKHAMAMAPSDFTRRDIAERFDLDPSSIPVAHCAVDPDFASLVDRLPAPTHDGPPRVLAVGNVVPRKNLVVLGKAIALLRARGLEIELRIVGQSGRDGEAICTALKASLGSGVSFSGFVTSEQLAAEYRRSDVFAFPSLYEGFGIPALEAMYAGVPVVVSRATSLPEVVGDAGRVVAPEDAEEWATAIERILSDDPLRAQLVARGRARAEAMTWASSATVVHRTLVSAAERG